MPEPPEADPTNREIAKELQVCMERSAASGDVLEYRHGYADERHVLRWAVAKSVRHVAREMLWDTWGWPGTGIQVEPFSKDDPCDHQ